MKLTIFILLLSFSVCAQMPVVVGTIVQKKGPGPSLGADQFVDDNVTGTGSGQNNYSGTPGVTWVLASNPAHYSSTLHYSNVLNATTTFTFVGRRIRWLAPHFTNHGIAGVTVDGGTEQFIDQYDPTGVWWTSNPDRTVIFDKTFPTEGVHTIVIRVTGEQNVASSGTYVFNDGWIINSDDDPVVPTPDGELWVDDDGLDTNPGTEASPFKTIQKASQIAQPGDIVKIKSGTYREAIFPVNSGTAGNEIIYEAETGATVVVSGYDLAGETGWTVHSGNIYKKTITLPVTGFRTAPAGMYGNGNTANAEITNTFIFANQIIKNGSMIIEASYPKGLNSDDDYFKMVADGTINSQWIFRSQTGFTDLGPTGVTDTHMDASPGSGWTTFATNDHVGSTALIQGWYVSNSATVTSNNGSNGRINWAVHNNRYGGPGAFWKYYRLTNNLKYLTQENEFYYGGGILYVWQPSGGSPTGIEFKARNWGFDLRNKSYIKVRGIQFIGCEPATGNSGTTHVTLDNIRAKYQNHSLTHSVFLNQGHGMAQFMGIKLGGGYNSVINSEFSYSASMCIWMGPNGLVQNNKFDHIGYDGMWGAPVSFWGMDNCNNISVLNNTAEYLGRGFVDNGAADGLNPTGGETGIQKSVKNNRIGYNDVSHFSMRVQDGGAFYSSAYQDISGMVIDHNIFHDMEAFHPPDGTSTDGLMAGIYFDQGSGAKNGGAQVKVTNNIFYNIGGANISFSSLGQTNLGNQWHNNSELTDIYSHPFCTGCTPKADVPGCIGCARNPGWPVPYNMATLYYNNTNASGEPGVNGVKSFITNQSAVTDVFSNNIFEGEYGFSGGTAPGNFGSTNKYRTNVSFVGGSLSTPLSYFQLQSGSSARGIGASVSTNSDDTSPKDAGALYYSQAAWTTPGYNAVSYTETP